MFERAVRTRGKLNPHLNHIWLVTILGIAGVGLFGSLALVTPTDFGYILVIAGSVICLLGLPAWLVLLLWASGEEKANKGGKPWKQL